MSELIQGVYTDLNGASTLLPIAVDATGQLLGTGGGGGGEITSADVVSAINSAVDVQAAIDTN